MIWKHLSDSEEEQRETLAVTAWMKEFASHPAGEGPLRDPAYLWWKAEMLRRWDAQQRASAPLEVGERVQAGIGLVAAAGFLIWLWRMVPGTAMSMLSITDASMLLGLTFTAALVAATAAFVVRDLIHGHWSRP